MFARIRATFWHFWCEPTPLQLRCCQFCCWLYFQCGKDWVSHSVLLCYQIKPTQAVCSAVLEQLFISLLHSAWTLFWYCHHPRRWTHPSCLWHPKPITRLISFDCSLFDRSTDSSTTSSSSSIHIHPFVVQSPLRTSSSTSRALGDVYSHRPWVSHGKSWRVFGSFCSVFLALGKLD
jgi:hypothetical protein